MKVRAQRTYAFLIADNLLDDLKKVVVQELGGADAPNEVAAQAETWIECLLDEAALHVDATGEQEGWWYLDKELNEQWLKEDEGVPAFVWYAVSEIEPLGKYLHQTHVKVEVVNFEWQVEK